MRKILYSPGYGAGWVSWHHGSREEKLFMLEYAPLIHAIENPEGVEVSYKNFPPELENVQENLDLAMVEALTTFVKDWKAKFGNKEVPYLGGARNLDIENVSGLVEIREYDGNESVYEMGHEEYL